MLMGSAHTGVHGQRSARRERHPERERLQQPQRGELPGELAHLRESETLSAGVIMRLPDGYALRAAGDHDIPRVNGRAVPEQGVKLRNGDIIEVAGTRLQFYLN